MAAIGNTQNIHVHLRQDFGSIGWVNFKKEAFNGAKSAAVSVDEATNAAALKVLLAEKIGVPSKHLSLRVCMGYAVSNISVFEKMNSIFVHKYSYGSDEPKKMRDLLDDELISEAIAAKPDVEKSREYTENNKVMKSITKTVHGPNAIHVGISNSIPHEQCVSKVEIMMLTGYYFYLSFAPETTVAQLKDQIGLEMNATSDQQRLVLNGKELQEHETLGSIGLQDGNSIHLILNLPLTSSAEVQWNNDSSL